MPQTAREPTPPRPRWVALGGLAVGATATAVLLFHQNFLLFHSLVEVFAIAVGAAVAMVAWNTRQMRSDDHVLFLGLAFGGLAFLGLVHVLSHPGMNVFQRSAEEASVRLAMLAHVWLAGALLLSPLVLGRRLAVAPAVLAATGGSILLVGLALHTEFVPPCYLPGVGPTPFARGAEALVVALLAGALLTHWRARHALDRVQLRILVAAILAGMAASVCSAAHVHPFDAISAAGHVFTLLLFVLVYWALVHLGLSQPFATMFRDLVQSVEELEQAANKDTLTGLYNRRGMLALGDAQLALARRLGLKVTVVFADLNGLKALNDEHGHAAGDQALKDMATLLGRTFRQADLLARVGGDEFVAMMIHGNGRHPLARLRAALAQHNDVAERPYALSVALGASVVQPGSQVTLEDVLELADAEMYTDKQRHYAERGETPRSER